MSKSVIDLAKQSGFWQEHLDTWMCSTSSMEFFANLVRNQTIDECVSYVRNLGFGTIASDAMQEKMKS